MKAVIEPTGCSVRRGAVQLRIDLFDDNNEWIHGHMIQFPPDVTDDKVRKKIKEFLDISSEEYKNGRDIGDYWHSHHRKPYAPFNVNATIENQVFDALREGKTPQIVGEDMSAHLVRSAIKGLDIAARKDVFEARR